MGEQVAFAEGVIGGAADAPQLIGGRCNDCRAVAFPQPPSCARCGSTDVAQHLLPIHGTLWTFTTQEFLPKAPYASGETDETFRPYGVGLVELDGEVRVESRLTTADVGQLRIGMAMELVVIPFRDDIVTFAFRPVAT
jgi:uncharacterized OB-fold protein